MSRDNPPADDPMQLMRDAYAQGIERWSKAMEEIVGSEDFASASGQLLALYAQQQQSIRAASRVAAESIQMPTTEDLPEVAQLVINVERKVDEVSDSPRVSSHGLTAVEARLGEATAGTQARPRSPGGHREGARRAHGGGDRLAGPVRAAHADRGGDRRARATVGRSGGRPQRDPGACRHAREVPARGGSSRAAEAKGPAATAAAAKAPAVKKGRLEGSRREEGPREEGSAKQAEGSEPEASTSAACPPSLPALQWIDGIGTVTVEGGRPAAAPGVDEVPTGTSPRDVVWTRNKTTLYRYRAHCAAGACHSGACSSTRSSTARTSWTCGPATASCATCSTPRYDVFLIDWGRPGWEDRGVTSTSSSASTCPKAVERMARAGAGDDYTLFGLLHGRHHERRPRRAPAGGAEGTS